LSDVLDPTMLVGDQGVSRCLTLVKVITTTIYPEPNERLVQVNGALKQSLFMWLDCPEASIVLRVVGCIHACLLGLQPSQSIL
jgi:hypothetical protein